jgi:hypothetical protein
LFVIVDYTYNIDDAFRIRPDENTTVATAESDDENDA